MRKNSIEIHVDDSLSPEEIHVQVKTLTELLDSESELSKEFRRSKFGNGLIENPGDMVDVVQALKTQFNGISKMIQKV
tara:strand:- start:865 stop:1098 length:234 start_codon:yes stop_codon:yes gene_type:complete